MKSKLKDVRPKPKNETNFGGDKTYDNYINPLFCYVILFLIIFFVLILFCVINYYALNPPFLKQAQAPPQKAGSVRLKSQ